MQRFNEYLEKFDFPITLLQTKEALETASYNLLEELKTQGVIYAGDKVCSAVPYK